MLRKANAIKRREWSAKEVTDVFLSFAGQEWREERVFFPANGRFR